MLILKFFAKSTFLIYITSNSLNKTVKLLNLLKLGKVDLELQVLFINFLKVLNWLLDSYFLRGIILIELPRVFLNLLLEPIDVYTHIPISFDGHCFVHFMLTLLHDIDYFLLSCFLGDGIKNVLFYLFLLFKRFLVLWVFTVIFLLQKHFELLFLLKFFVFDIIVISFSLVIHIKWIKFILTFWCLASN